jgi:hypothetical protein
MDDFQQELLERLPLAQAVFALFSHVLSGPFLEEVYEEFRGRCYERELSFPQMVYLIRDALLEHQGSGQQSFERAREAGELPVAIGNAYGKLSRLPVPLSIGLLAQGAQRIAALMPRGSASAVPASLAGFQVVALDGKKLKNAAKRLKALRGMAGKLLSAKLLVALNLHSGLVTAMSVDQDGEANDVPLVPPLLPQVRQKLGGVILWVADSQFCDLGLPGLFTQQDGHFLLRWSSRLSFHPDPARPQQQGQDARGRRFVQEWGWVGSQKDKRRRYVRRVTLYRPGERDVSVITDLLDEKLHPAEDLLELYLMRWGIERVFQQVSEVFELRKLIGSTPQAGVFQAAFCLLLYDMVQVCKAYAGQAAGRKTEEVSGEKLFYDINRELIAWAAVGEPAHAAAYLIVPLGAAELREKLVRWVGGSWTERWVKARNKSPRTPQKRAKQSGAHTSVWRVLHGRGTTSRERIRS